MVTQGLLEELGARAVVCEGWEWLGGMKMLTEHDDPTYRLTYIPGEYTDEKPEVSPVRVLVPGGGDCAPAWGWPSEDSGWKPDLSDPATVGCLLQLVRKKHGVEVYTHPVTDEKNPTKWEVELSLRWGRRLIAAAPTEAEALVAALESAT